MLASSLSRVMPALWTMMSSEPCRFRAWSTIRAARVRRRHVELQSGAAEPVRVARQALSRRRDVDADDGRAVASEHLGDRRADPPSGAGDDGDLAGQRGMPVVRGHGRAAGGGAHRDDLAVDVGRASGEEEPQRGVGVGLLTLDDGDEVGRGAGPQLLADRPDHTLQGPAGGAQHRVGAGGRHRAPEHHDATAGRQSLQGRRRGSSGRRRDRSAPAPGSGRGPPRRPVAPRRRRG